MIGTRIDHRVLEEASRHTRAGLADCVAVGRLQEESDGAAFRHELAREAILESIDPLRRRSLYRTVLKAATKSSCAGRSGLAQLAHYAEGAADARAVVEHGVAAAEAATTLGAQREAAQQYQRVLRFADERPAAQRARYLASYAEACATIDNLGEATKAYQEAIELWREAGDRLKEGETLAALAWPLVRSGQNAAAERASQQAIAVLETIRPTPQMAFAYRTKAHLRMLDRDLDHATHYMTAWLALTRLYQGRWADADDLASKVIAEPNLSAVSRIMALVAVGRVRARRGDPGAKAALDEALELASTTETVAGQPCEFGACGVHGRQALQRRERGSRPVRSTIWQPVIGTAGMWGSSRIGAR